MKLLINNSKLKCSNIFKETDYERWERKEQFREVVSDVMASIFAFILLILIVIVVGSISDAKMKKQYVGELVCTTYHVSDNTPKGTRATSTGHRATEWKTIAVDRYDPKFKIGTKLHIKGFGDGIVEDVGAFARYGTHLDLFTPEGVGFKKRCKVWVYRKETKKEKAARLKKVRERLQAQTFTLVGGKNPVGTIVADPEYIKKGATVIIGWNFYEVTETRKGLGNTLLIGGLSSVRAGVRLTEVVEEAVG